jgi:hypothetical protein
MRQEQAIPVGQLGARCEAFGLPLSAHTAPSPHAHPCCAVGRVCHVEYFHGHARIARMVFDGAPTPVEGELRPDLSRPGLGLEFKRLYDKPEDEKKMRPSTFGRPRSAAGPSSTATATTRRS